MAKAVISPETNPAVGDAHDAPAVIFARGQRRQSSRFIFTDAETQEVFARTSRDDHDTVVARARMRQQRISGLEFQVRGKRHVYEHARLVEFHDPSLRSARALENEDFPVTTKCDARRIGDFIWQSQWLGIIARIERHQT